MKPFHFTKIYFRKYILDDPDSKIRVVIKEKPSIEITEEDYSLRITTRYEYAKIIHRDYAIEHHLPPAKHAFPHLQFKFHTEGIGQLRIRIDVLNEEEYRKAILGFIYLTKNILGELEQFRDGITNEILVLDLVAKLDKESKFLLQKIQQGIQKYALEFDKGSSQEKIQALGNHPLLLSFIGKTTMKTMQETYAAHGRKDSTKPL
ncbi:hypothetical protein HYW21_01455 [Candidatus Woesearchaeota archaeon]|nr:hypothetical protein [Candidatus Woesearchaeota archaeon]